MNQLIRLAWKNIWRKKGRSIIAVLSVAFAVFLSINFRSLQWGAYNKMIDAAVQNSGYIQIHYKNYWKNKSVNDLIVDNESIRKKILAVDGSVKIIPRLQNFSLATGDKNTNTKGALILGINPEDESKYNKLKKRLIKGEYINSKSEGIMLTEGIAKYLNLDINDTISLIGQGYHSEFAAGKFKIVGIVKHMNPQLNKLFIYMPLSLAQHFNDADGMISALLINIDQNKDYEKLSLELKTKLGTDYEIMTWDELQPEVKQYINSDSTIGNFMLTALYLVIGMGIIGTIIMMGIERKREFGMLQAIGLQKNKIQLLIVIESLMLGLIGVFIGFILATPLVYHLNHNPIPITGEGAKAFEGIGIEPTIQLAIRPSIYLNMAKIILLIMILASLVVMVMIRKIKMANVIK